MTKNVPTNLELSPSRAIRVSNSQISKYMRCPKKWWYTYGPLQLKEPTSKKAALGTAVHAVLEAYLRDGTPIPDTPAGRIASVGLDKLRPAEDLEIERSITLPLNDAANMLCRIDMLGKNEPYVGDHKTTSDLKWVKTRAQVARDIQLMTYAYAGYHETKPDTVTGELIYYVREGQKVSMAVGAEFSWEDIEENWRLMGEIAREMLPRKTDPTGETCAGNSSACGDYGGCFFQDRCPVSPRNASKIKKEFAESCRPANNGTEINPEEEQHMSGFLDEMMTRPNKRPPGDNGSSFGGFAAPSVLPPEHPAPTRQAAATAPIFDDVKAAPVPAPVETVAQRTPTSCGKKEQEEIGALFREHRMSHPANWEITEEQAESVVEDLIKKHTGRNMTKSRFVNVIKFAGYVFEEGLLVDTRLAPTEGPFNPGYTADPQGHDAEDLTDDAQQWEALAENQPTAAQAADREDYERRSGKTSPKPENAPMVFETEKGRAIHMIDLISECTRHADAISKGWASSAHAEVWEIGKIFDTRGTPDAALDAPCVLFVDVAHTGADAETVDGWLDPIKLQAKDAHPQKDYPSYLAADLDYGAGAKLLAHVLKSHTEPPAGLWMMRSTHKEAEVVLATFERLGACIVYGN